MPGDALDVAIVGGGVSGAWCGWRLTGELAGNGRRRSVALFEGSGHIGGRLLSVHLPGLEDIPLEVGGMRYMSTQPLVSWLVESVLCLKTEPAPVGQDRNIAYLRNRRLRLADLTNPNLVPYDLEGADRGVSPNQLLNNAILAIVPEAKGKTGPALRKVVREAIFEGRPVWAQGFWNMLSRTMEPEAYRFAEEAGGYDTVLHNWNGAETILLNYDFSPDVEFLRLTDGYEEVPQQLTKLFVSQGGELFKRHRVCSVDVVTLDDGTTGVALEVEDGATGSRHTVRARNAILAMPRRALELLEPTGPVLADPAFRSLLTTVTPIPLFKAFVAYHRPWWEQVGVTSGRSVTDLPLRQIYYWATKGPEQDSVLLATYDDTLNVTFWQGYAADERRYGLQLDHLPAERREAIRRDKVDERWREVDAPASMVAELHRQLVRVHGVDSAPAPYAALYHDWSGDPYGGGVNLWNIGVKAWEVERRMVHPVAGAPVYVCGEAYSTDQGWVEGALATAEQVVAGHLGAAPLPLHPPPGS